MQPQQHQTLAVATWKAALLNLRLRFITGVETSARIKQNFFFLEVNNLNGCSNFRIKWMQRSLLTSQVEFPPHSGSHALEGTVNQV